MRKSKWGIFALVILALFLFLGGAAWGAEDSLRIIYTGNTLSNLVPSG